MTSPYWLRISFGVLVVINMVSIQLDGKQSLKIKSKGGLGIRNLMFAKHALMAKNLFAILNEDDKFWVMINCGLIFSNLNTLTRNLLRIPTILPLLGFAKLFLKLLILSVSTSKLSLAILSLPMFGRTLGFTMFLWFTSLPISIWISLWKIFPCWILSLIFNGILMLLVISWVPMLT